jgi:thioesterase domain-containing protein
MGRGARYDWIARHARTPEQIWAELEARGAAAPKKQTGYVAPRTDLERDLCVLWQKVLRLERVGIQDDFFELGGHSLLAVRLFAQLDKLIQRKLPVITIFQAPTVEQLAGAISGGSPIARSARLVPIQAEGSRRPLFLVHGAGGDVLWGYANLAQCLGRGQPIYGLRSDPARDAAEFGTLEAMAQAYVREVRRVQPRGPYQVGGYCFGGNVAYEMARQLQAEGEEVAVLALLDSAPSHSDYQKIRWWRPQFVFRFGLNLVRWLSDFRDLKPEERRTFFRRKLRSLQRKLCGYRGSAAAQREVDLEDMIDVTQFSAHELKRWQAHLTLLEEHTSRPYQGRVTLFRTRGHPLLCSFDPDLAWGPLVRGGVDVHVIPGSHESIFIQPNVQHLAVALERALTAAPAAPAVAPVAPVAQP